VVLHLEFKGQFSWGQWVFYSKDIPIPAGSSTVSDEVNAPYKSLIEPASEFYYYVYVTLPGDEWTPSAWELTQSVTVVPPVDVTRDELVSCMSHLKWLVDTSSLSDGIKQSLFTKLEAAGIKIENAYDTGNLDKLPGAVGSLKGSSMKLNRIMKRPHIRTQKRGKNKQDT